MTIKLSFREVNLSDAGVLCDWFNDKDNMRFMSTIIRCRHHTPEQIEKDIREFDDRYERLYMIMAEGHAQPIGHAGIDDIDFDDSRAELFYLIGDKSFHGKGLAKQIVRLLLDKAFSELKLNSIFASACVENLASIKSLEGQGFRRIGVRRQYNKMGERFVDELFFDLTKSDYLESRKHKMDK